jgi:hypothetical protein
MSAAVTKLADTATADLGRAKGLAIQRLHDSLYGIIRRHAATARETLLAQPRFTRHNHVWQYRTLPLRRDLEREFQTIYREAADRLRAIERTANATILNEIRALVPANALAGEGASIHMADPEPSISALGQTVAVDLDDQWRAWWRLWHGQKQRARKLEELLIADFRPVVDVLVDAAEAELDAYVALSVQRFSQLARDLVAVASRRRRDLEADRDQMKTERSAQIQEYQARQKQLEQRIRSCASIADALKLLISRP